MWATPEENSSDTDGGLGEMWATREENSSEAPPDYTDEEAQQVLPKHIAEMIEAGPEPEPPAEKALSQLSAVRWVCQFDPKSVALADARPVESLPSYEELEQWVGTFVAELRQLAKRPARIVRS